MAALPIFLPNFLPFSSNLLGFLGSMLEPDWLTAKGKLPYSVEDVGCGIGRFSSTIFT
jgi:hypothetical protein